jgi:uridine kinase
MNTVTVRLSSGQTVEVPYGSRVNELLVYFKKNSGKQPIVAALVNNELTSLTYRIEVNSTIRPITLDSNEGGMTYRRSLVFLLAMAVGELYSQYRLLIGHSLGDSYFLSFADIVDVSQADLDLITEKMEMLAAEELVIRRRYISYCEAIDYFEKKKQLETVLLLKFRNESKVAIYQSKDFLEIAHVPLVPNTKILSKFELKKYMSGFLLRYPPLNNPGSVESFSDRPLLFSIYQEYKEWGGILNVSSTGRLNSIVQSGEIKDFITVAESLHDKKIAKIADSILSRGKETRIILIAGPSSSGKTTFSKKLSIQLRVLGLSPLNMSLDDYFVPRSETPLDNDGNPDFECLDAIDVALLNDHLIRLFRGEAVHIPEYDFKEGLRKEDGKSLQLKSRDILILEGIHGLNDALTPLIKPKKKYKIYVSALTQLNLDDHNRIPTTDNRLIRRIVRDHQFRGHSATDTLNMWPSVRRGENINIFPFQETADSAFNSALDYELGVLKLYAEPLLKQVKPFDDIYHEAIRLLTFLDNFIPILAKNVPPQSILREFIGDSGFKY